MLFAEAPPAAANGQEPDSAQQNDALARFAVNVNLVNLFFEVKDSHGMPVLNLKQDQFEVLENGKPQAIRYFRAGAIQPLTLGLLVDTSGSARRVLPIERQLGAEFFHRVLQPDDLAFVIRFDVGVDLLQDLTSTSPLLLSALQETDSNSGDWLLPGKDGFPDLRKASRGTLLYDAIYLAATEELQHEVGRKVIVVITDGIDQGSQMKLSEVIEAAQKADTAVYVLLTYDPEYGARSQDIGRICKETGGRVLDLGPKAAGLEKAIQEITNELHAQYYIGYTPTLPKMDGSFRRLQVRVKNSDLHVQLRKGYYRPKD